jgi:hypothetical protein
VGEVTARPPANDVETLTRGEAYRTVAILGIGLLLKAGLLTAIAILLARGGAAIWRGLQR